MNNDAVIVAIGRSPVGRAGKGSFKDTHPVDLAAQTLKGVLAQVPQLKEEEIGDIVVGCAQPEGAQGFNVARMIAQRAGLHDRVCGQTVNRFCSSGLQALSSCTNAIMAGQEEIMVAGGIESMTFVDMKNTDLSARNPWLEKNIPGNYLPMGITAENVAEMYKVTRREMDEFAVQSHKKAAKAQEDGYLQEFIIPITVKDEKGNERIVSLDEGIRKGTNMDSLSALRPCFKEDGLVTAATSSQVSDGAGFAVLMSQKKAIELGIRPLATFKSFAVGGIPSEIMGIGPMVAVPKVLKKADLTLDDMDIVELNEAFAAQAIPCINELKLDSNKVNPYGGAIALGHPMGATGIILTCKAITYLKHNKGRYGMITMCIGGGMGAAGIIEV